MRINWYTIVENVAIDSFSEGLGIDSRVQADWNLSSCLQLGSAWELEIIVEGDVGDTATKDCVDELGTMG